MCMQENDNKNNIENEENDNKKRDSKMREFIAKVKTIKHIEIIIALIVIAVVIVAYICVSQGDNIKKTEANSNDLTIELQNMLSKIKGVGDVEVLIVYNGGNIIEIASKVDKHTTVTEDDGRVTTVIDEVTSPILTDGDKPLVIGEKRAEIDGVMVVCEGGSDSKVRVQVIQAISLLLKIDFDCINVFEMK